MIPELIEFKKDRDGNWHFANEAMPFKTTFNVRDGLPMHIKVEESRGRVSITLDGRTVVYERTAFGQHEEWICVLRIGQPSDDGDS